MMQEMGWYVRSRIAWCKKASKPESVQDRPTSGWEHVWMFSKSRSYFYDVAATKTGDSQMRNYWVLGPNTGEPWEYCNGCGTLYTGHSRAKIARVDGQRVCAECGDDGGWTGHYATYPLALPERCILAGSSEGGVCVQCYTPLRRDKLTSNWFNACKCPEWRTTPATVLDVCMGSGTTMLAALKHRRGVIGIDMSQDYVNIADGRATSAGYEQTVRRSRQWQAQAI
jgi:DNA modification methylase